MNKQQALEAILDIAKRFNLTENDINHALRNAVSLPSATSRSAPTVGSVLFYLGGVFVLAGIAALVGLNWENLDANARILITLGSGLVCFIISIAVHFQFKVLVLAQVLACIAWVLEFSGGLILLVEKFIPWDDWDLNLFIVGGITFIQFLIFAFYTRSTSIVIATNISLISAMGGGLIYFGLSEPLIYLLLGVVFFIISHIFVNTKHDMITPITYFFATILFLFGLFKFVENKSYDVLFVIPTILVLVYGVVYKSRTVLFFSALTLLGFLSYYIFEHFANKTGIPLALVICGASFIIVGLIVAKLKQKFIS